jgi:chromosome segregation ATPase
MTSATNAAIDAAKSNLASLEADAAAAERVRLVAQLKAIREDIRQSRARYGELKILITEQRQDLSNAQGDVERASAAVADSQRAKPAAAQYLSEDDDEEVRSWHKAHAKVTAEHARLVAVRDALPDPQALLAEAINFEGPFGLVAQLEYSERNLLAALDGRSGKAFVSEGGVSGVR